MSEEEICLRLIELYYENVPIFYNLNISLTALFKKYNEMLKLLKVESDE